MNKVRLVQQVQQSECGLCSVLMILRYYKSYDTLEDLREILEAGRDGLNIVELKQLLEERKFKTRIIRSKIEKVEEVGCLNQLKLPFIAYWNNEHFLVVSKIKSKYIEVFDSASGRRKLKHEEFLKHFSGYILEAIPTEEFVPKKEKPKRWNYILKQLLKEKKIIVGVSLLSLISYFLTIVFSKLTQWFVDNYIMVDNEVKYDFKNIIIGIGLFILLTIIITFTRNFSVVIMKVKTESVLLKRVFAHLLKLPYSFFETRTHGDLISRLGSVNYVKDFILDNVIGSIFNFGVGVVLFIYIGTISYKILLVTTILVLINCLSIILTRKPIEYLNKEEILNSSKVNSVQVETIFSIFTTKILRLEDIIFKNWNDSFKKYLLKRKEREYYQACITSVSSILNIISPIIIVLFGYIGYKNNIISLGEIMITQSFIINLLSISSNIVNTCNTYLIASNYLDRVVDITNKEIEDVYGESLDVINDIEFKNVDFSYYKNGNKVLKNISIKIKRGEKIAFVGGTGSGKSTIAKLLMGLYEPTEGQVLINSVDLKNISKKSYLNLATIVPQDIYIYTKNILENIKLERKDTTVEDVENAAKVACIHDEIMNFPLKYKTMLSDRGMNLSGGQRQRIVIARSVLSNPNLIVFDEGTSYLDNLTEKNIMKNLKEKKATIIMIAHRLETIIDCDRIYLIKDGEIIESGSHEELMKMEGQYYNLYTTKSNKVKECI